MRGWLGLGMFAAACGHSSETLDAAIDAGPSFGQHAVLTKPMPQPGDHFGDVVAMSGDGARLAISVLGPTVGGVLPVGGVYVFARTATGWDQEAVLQPNVAHAGDEFAATLGMSALGDTIVVGSLAESSNATGVDGDALNSLASGSGAAYVFERSGKSWGQQAYLKASNAEKFDQFGWVGISGDGNTIAVGAPDEASSATGIDGDQTSNSASQSGSVYVFTTDGTTWRQQAYLKASNTGTLDRFGNRVALSSDGSTLAVGAGGEDSGATGIDGDQTDETAVNSGAAYVFRRTQDQWAQSAYVKASNTRVDAAFGDSMALSGVGTTLVIGASAEQGNGSDPGDVSLKDAGAAYVFSLDGGTWSQAAYLKAAHPMSADHFGDLVAISRDGKIIAASAPGDDAVNMDSGAIALFAQSAGAWRPLATVKSPEPGPSEHVGSPALSSSGEYLLVGVPFTDVNLGAAYIYY